MRTISHPPSTANERTRLLAEAARLLDAKRSCLASPQPPRDLAAEIANRLEGTLVSQASRPGSWTSRTGWGSVGSRPPCSSPRSRTAHDAGSPSRAR